MTDDLLDFLNFAPSTETVHVEVEREDGHTLLSLYIRRTNRSGWRLYPMIFRDDDGDDIGAAVEARVRQHHAEAPPDPPALRTSRDW